MTKLRLAMIAAAFTALVVFGGVSWYMGLHHGPRNFATVTDPSQEPGGAFSLVDQDGRPVTEGVLKGKWTAVFFGYTYCPDFCPLTLQNLALVQKKLGDRAHNFQVVFISIDPARDTPAALKSYLASGGMPKGAIGLTGSQAQIDHVTKAYRAPAQKIVTGDTYSFQHITTVYLMDPNGRYNSVYGFGLDSDTTAGLIKDAMDGK